MKIGERRNTKRVHEIYWRYLVINFRSSFFSEIFSGTVKSKVNLWKLNIWIDTKLMGKFEIGQGNVTGKNIFAIVMISSLIRKITEISSFSQMY